MLKKTSFTIHRLTTSGQSRSYQATAEKLTGTLEPMDAEFSALSGGGFGKSFRIFTSKIASTVREGDRLRSASNRDFDVKGVIKYTDNLPRHLEIMVEESIKQ